MTPRLTLHPGHPALHPRLAGPDLRALENGRIAGEHVLADRPSRWNPGGHDRAQQEPRLTLTREGQATRYHATVGCNQLVGTASVTGPSLSFKSGATTQMACVPPFDALERSLAETLGRTRRYAITGGTLELLDQSGGWLALLEAVPR